MKAIRSSSLVKMLNTVIVTGALLYTSSAQANTVLWELSRKTVIYTAEAAGGWGIGKIIDHALGLDLKNELLALKLEIKQAQRHTTANREYLALQLKLINKLIKQLELTLEQQNYANKRQILALDRDIRELKGQLKSHILSHEILKIEHQDLKDEQQAMRHEIVLLKQRVTSLENNRDIPTANKTYRSNKDKIVDYYSKPTTANRSNALYVSINKQLIEAKQLKHAQCNGKYANTNKMYRVTDRFGNGKTVLSQQGYEFSDRYQEDRWIVNTPHSSCNNLVASPKKDFWVPKLGYQWSNSDPTILDVEWVSGIKSPHNSLIVSSNTEGLWDYNSVSK